MNRRQFLRFPYTFVALALAFLVLVAAVFVDINAFNLPDVSTSAR